MKLAIMQPYFFPYIGYWQLINAVDRFVIYDDVNYIKGGWINRNRLLINGEPRYITVPLEQSSSHKLICDIVMRKSPLWRNKLVRMIEITYRKAPCFDEVFPVVEKLIRHQTDSLSDYLSNQLQTLSSFMGIDTRFVLSSRCYNNKEFTRQERILDICKHEAATVYVNLQGGRALYDTESFRNSGMDLRFMVTRPIPYKQRAEGFVPSLSIIDVLMENGPSEIKCHLDAFDLIAVA